MVIVVVVEIILLVIIVVVILLLVVVVLIPGLGGVHVEGDHPRGQVDDGVLRHLWAPVCTHLILNV